MLSKNIGVISCLFMRLISPKLFAVTEGNRNTLCQHWGSGVAIRTNGNYEYSLLVSVVAYL